MKLCKDCINIILPDRRELTDEEKYNHAKCKKAGHADFVTGKTLYYYCKTQRVSNNFEDDCGPDAKHFEPKER